MVASGTSPLDLESLRELINLRLAQLVPEGHPRGPAAAARHSLLASGKRLRAVITLIAARSQGGSIEDALDVACAVEMIHTSSLVFDDLPAMDNADLRRGEPTAHKAFGEDIAILAGIGLINGAYEVIAQSKALTAERRMEVLRIMTRSVGWQGLVHGQALDLSSGADDARVDAIHEGKTGALFIAAAECGGLCAPECSDNQRRSLRAYGRALGFAYQAFDDVLDQVVADGGKSTAVLGGRSSLASAKALANRHLDQAVAAVGESSKLAKLAEFIRTYFARTIAA